MTQMTRGVGPSRVPGAQICIDGAGPVSRYLRKWVYSVLATSSDGLHPSSNGLQPGRDGLHPGRDGLHPSSNGLQPSSFLLLVAMLVQIYLFCCSGRVPFFLRTVSRVKVYLDHPRPCPGWRSIDR